jgi:CBS domain-containing protein
MATAQDQAGAERPTAADVMTPSPRTCSNYSTVLEVAMIMRDADCGAVPVVQDGTPIGVITDRDIALSLTVYPDVATRPVTDVMTKGVITVEPDATLAEVRETMMTHAVRRVLVVDDAKQLVGIVAWADLAPAVSDRVVGEVVSEVVEQPPQVD